jgi:hypothetical protein
MSTPPGLKELSSDARGFLYSFFNQAAMQFKESTKVIEPGLVEVVTPPRDSLAFAFYQASALARRGSLAQMNDAINTLVKKAKAATDPAEQDAMEGVRLTQSLFYRGQVRDNRKLQADLGSYASGIF